ncbi:hypothetical protein FDP41_010289 [Naegleria fowleri]|uniref:Uncharacterized protein n=1 Tax=Naegleria fowleri TaxID=5763 RepID=A0A6A5C9L0_NAEFO|nr:uncharacterized protein FDP41_010289 [Naegleria fowleri]KAF0983224.1 hypothetical protein FDP41_010289 [Naegleria fowleri]
MGNRSKFVKATGDAIIDLKAVREVLRHRKELRHRYFEFANLEEWIHTNPSDGKEYTTLEDLGCFYDDWKIRYLDKEWIQVLNDLYDCMIIRGIPNSNLPKVASQGRQHSPPEYRSGTLESLILEYQKNIHSEEKITLNEFKTLVKPLLLVHPDPVLKIKGGIGFQDVSIKTLERNDSDDDSCEEEVQHVVEESSSKSLKKSIQAQFGSCKDLLC